MIKKISKKRKELNFGDRIKIDSNKNIVGIIKKKDWKHGTRFNRGE
jgi:hypothetical protein